MWAEKRSKLMSEDPMDANTLRDILYTLFTDDTPVDVGQGIEAQMEDGATPTIQITNAPDTVPIASIARRNGDSIVLSLNLDGTLSTSTNGDRPVSGGSGGGSALPSVFPGVVVSGTGSTYIVDTYPNGTAKPSVSATVTQLRINPSKTIAAGTWAIITKNGGLYSMQVPVWG